MEVRDLRRKLPNYSRFSWKKTNGTDPASVWGIWKDVIFGVENIVSVDNLPYDIDIVDGSLIGVLASRSIWNYSDTLFLLQDNSQICCLHNFPGTLWRHLLYCVRNSSEELRTCRDIWRPAKIELEMSSQRLRITSGEHCLTN